MLSRLPRAFYKMIQKIITQKISWLCLFLALYLALSALPAQAGKLLQWNFNARQNQLEFTTDEGVQPRAQLITNPTRLVIDLPGTRFGRKQLIEPIVNAPGVQSLRVGQFDPQTARLVLELSPGYTIDPNQVRFEGVTPRRWRINLPTIIQQATVPGGDPTSVPVPAPSGNPVFTPPPSTRPPLPGLARTQVQGFQVTGDGFFIRTSGDQPLIQITRSFDRRQLYIDLQGANLTRNAAPLDVLVNQRGISRAILSQSRPNPPTVRLTLNVAPNSGEWQARSTPDGSGVIVIPQWSDAPAPGVPGAPVSRLNTIQVVEIEGDRQLVIRGSDRLTFSGNWDRSTGGYRIVLPFSQLAPNVRGPVLTASSPLLEVRLRNDDPQTVSILAFPASGIQLGELNQPNPQSLVLQLRRSGFQPIPSPTFPPTRIPAGRQVVVIDPGHGGPDPGAVGIGGIQEKEIVLDISTQVAAILEQQGVSTVMTRRSDIDLDLAPRVEMAAQVRATVFVSIHANAISMSRPEVNGLETYYYDSGYDLARSIHANVLQTASIRDRGVRSARFYVLRRTSMPSVLVETGFVTGAEDAANLANSGHRRQMAEGIARGILQYIRGGR